ncbi:MAG TPA: DUF4337 domain-containing protein [Microvirga sp.]|jgi:hypothetical protein|nr:DUF4337 domain-containing protein [Microvirga sp.]
MDARDAQEALEETGSRNGRVALLIAMLAACLAIVEVSGGNADQDATKYNIDAANLWAFFQAKTIRRSEVLNFADLGDLALPDVRPERQDAFRQQIRKWRETADRYESEPSTNEGRRELMARAQAAEQQRDLALAAGDKFDYASGAFQLGIVLASSAIVLGIVWLIWLAGGLGLLGITLAVLGWFAPALI